MTLEPYVYGACSIGPRNMAAVLKPQMGLHPSRVRVPCPPLVIENHLIQRGNSRLQLAVRFGPYCCGHGRCRNTASVTHRWRVSPDLRARHARFPAFRDHTAGNLVEIHRCGPRKEVAGNWHDGWPSWMGFAMQSTTTEISHRHPPAISFSCSFIRVARARRGSRSVCEARVSGI
jgi:hypothetical protein